MPELPEVETIKLSLRSIVGEQIAGIEILRPDIIRRLDFEPEDICNNTIKNISRRGKYLAMKIRENRHLVLHMGMTGRFYISRREITEKHVHLIIHLESGYRLIFQDPRRFGGVWFIKDIKGFFAGLGPEPLDREFNVLYLQSIAAGRRVAVKTLLLNQKLVAGLGNIYTDEALHKAGIMPLRPAGSLAEKEIALLVAAIKEVLRQGIEQRGTTFRDYRDGLNQSGSFQGQLKVYGRAGKRCQNCEGIINKIVLNGRSTHFCPGCQK